MSDLFADDQRGKTYEETDDGDEHESQPWERVGDQEEGPEDAGKTLEVPIPILRQPVIHLLHV